MSKFINHTDRNRLDNFIMSELENSKEQRFLTRSQLKNLICTKGVKVNNILVNKAGYQLKINDLVEIEFSSLSDNTIIEPYIYPLNIVYEDQDLIVINKSADLTVHPGAGNPNRTLLNALAYYFSKQQPFFLVHRLDKDTTGLILVAKNEESRVKLVEQFSSREIKRVYNALALVTPRSNRQIQKAESGRIETMYARSPTNKLEMSVVDENGRVAITNWKVLSKFPHAYLLELRLETGRTHQIRVHLEHIGSPIIGDLTYGDFSLLPKELLVASKKFGRQALHAKKLQFIHPRTGTLLALETDLPLDFQQLIDKFACSS